MKAHHHIRYTLRVTRYNRKIHTVLRSYALTVFFLSPFSFLPLFAQQVQLKGVVTVQNSKTYTGNIQFVKNAEVEHINQNNAKAKDITGDDGKFTLNIKGAGANTQTQINVTPFGEFADYVVVNEKELKDITLGRLTPVSVFVCKKGELEKRQAEMVGINMRKLEEKMEADKKRLQKELDAIRANNDYLNVRYSQIKDSLDIISKNIDNAFERIKEYAKTMTLENLDDRDENYVKAYACFSRGALDSVSYYLQEHELDLKYQKIVQLQQEAKKEKELAAVLTESAKAKDEFTENSMNELIKEWLLLARTYNMKNDYEKAMNFYEKVIQADTLNIENIHIYANYLLNINEFEKAENYFSLGLSVISKISDESAAYRIRQSRILGDYARLYYFTNEISVAMEKNEEAIRILKEFDIGNDIDVLRYLSNFLLNVANLHLKNIKYPEALNFYNEALEIRRKLYAINPQEYQYDMAQVLGNMAVLYLYSKDYPQALQKNEEALLLYRKLADENYKTNISNVAATLNNIALVHIDLQEYDEAMRKLSESIGIYKELAYENPKVYMPYLANLLGNYVYLYRLAGNCEEGVKYGNESLEIYKELAIVNPKAYLFEVGRILYYTASVHSRNKDFANALLKLEEALEIFGELFKTNKNANIIYIAATLTDIASSYMNFRNYQKALEKFEEALVFIKEMADDNPDTFSAYYGEVYNAFIGCLLLINNIYQAESCARKALEKNDNDIVAKIMLAHALLFQNRFLEAETIYKELIRSELSKIIIQRIFDDFDELEQAGAIPQERKADVEKIREMLKGKD